MVLWQQRFAQVCSSREEAHFHWKRITVTALPSHSAERILCWFVMSLGKGRTVGVGLRVSGVQGGRAVDMGM